MYTEETKGTRNAINVNAGSLTHSSYIECHQGRLPLSRGRTGPLAVRPFRNRVLVVPSEMLSQVVGPRKAIPPYAGAPGLRAVDEFFFMCRPVVSDYIRFAG